MSIRVLTTRLVMPGREAVLIGMLKKLQAEAVTAPGFLASTAFREADSPTTMVVISEWHDVPSWNRWLEKMERHQLLDSMREHVSAVAV